MTMETLSAVRVVFVTQSGVEFPVRFEAGEAVPMAIRVQLTDGRVVSATAVPSRTVRL